MPLNGPTSDVGVNIPMDPDVSGAGGALGGSGSILKMLGAANPYINAAMGIGGLVGQIASLFKTSPEGQDKKTATGIQENIQNFAFAIQKAVQSGQVRPEVALNALNALEKQTDQYAGMSGQGSGSEHFGAGAQTAKLIISQVKQQIENGLTNDYTAYVNAPFRDPSQPYQGANAGMPSAAPGAGLGQMMNVNDAGLNEGLQNTRVRTGLRNYLLGADNSLAGTPLTQGLTPHNPYDLLAGASDATSKYFKPVPTPPTVKGY